LNLIENLKTTTLIKMKATLIFDSFCTILVSLLAYCLADDPNRLPTKCESKQKA
jgi:hypothetical protein